MRHFLARFFDTEIGASSGDWQKVAIGIFATLVSLGLLGFQVYQARFRMLQDAANSTPQLYQATVREDFLSLLAITMALTALLTLLQWQSLFPSLRDYMALTGFPVSARQIFVAKFAALVLLFVAYVLSLTGPLAGFFGWVIRGNWQENPSGTVPHSSPHSPPSPAPVPSSSLLSWPCKVCCSTSCPAAGFCASRSSCRPPCSSPPSARFRYSPASRRPPYGGRRSGS